jgi:transcriptional regulator with XRE-family HTH domain
VKTCGSYSILNEEQSLTKSQKPSHNEDFYHLAQKVALRVQSLRRTHGDTMEQLAVACGVTRGTVHKIEHPNTGEDVSLATLFAMTKHFGITLDQLFQEIEQLKMQPTEDDSQQSRWFQHEDYLAITLLPEHQALQIRADLSEQACLQCTEPLQLEALAKHASKLRKRRFSLTLQKSKSK